MPLKVYEYDRCSTCKNALKFLNSKSVEFIAIPIVENPPSKKELRDALIILKQNGATLKNLFNTSGELYKAMGIAAKLKNGMSDGDAIDLLTTNGKLIKRPFVIGKREAGKNIALVGFKADEWQDVLKSISGR